jgi:23S rRNA (uracil1939-C5)-methyltransferase
VGRRRVGASRPRRLATRVDEQWTIDRLVPGGDGFVRLADGRPAFVSGGLPGDRLRVLAVEDHKGHRRARSFSMLEAGPSRRAAPCADEARCGGCDWMRLDRAAQLEWKRRLVVEALARTAGLSDIEVSQTVVAGESLGYRRRVRVQVSDAKVGFFGRGTRSLIEFERCEVAHPNIGVALELLRGYFREAPTDRGVEAIEVRVDCRQSTLVRLLGPGAEACAQDLAPLVLERGISVVGPSARGPFQHFELGDGLTLWVEPDAFTQVNWEVNRAIVRAVVDEAVLRGAQSFVDLYAGVGNFTVPLLGAGLAGTAVEHSRGASRSAARTIAELGLSGAELLTGDAAALAADLARAGRRFDLALLDPPRSGARDVLPTLPLLGTMHILYVGCDPVTMARDIKELGALGYALEKVTPFDMFPQTHHVEVAGWLRRIVEP